MIYYSKSVLNDFNVYLVMLRHFKRKLSFYLGKLGRKEKMYKCELYEVPVADAGIMYGITSGEECRLVSFNLDMLKRIIKLCNQYGIDPIHLEDIIADEMTED